MNTSEPRAIVWSVAGSDSGGGAGLQADMRAFDAFDVHGCTAVAAITAQNSVAVQGVQAVEPALLDAQLAALAADMPPRAIKTGLLGSVDNVKVLASWVRRLRQVAPVALVVDPVWRASTGADLSSERLRRALLDDLLPLATMITPNRAEAAWLLDRAPITTDAQAADAAIALRRRAGHAVVVTGGDAATDAALDVLCTPQADGWLRLPAIATSHTHGSGCCFAASVAAALALGHCEADAAVLAKMATAHALRRATAAGAGAGPVRPAAGFGLQAALLPTWHDGLPAGARQRFAPIDGGALGLYVIVDRADWVARMAAAGVRTIQLRIKQAGSAKVSAAVREAVHAAQRHGARLFVNDHWALALEHGAYGVHLGQQDLDDADLQTLAAAGLRLGVSTHAPWEVARAWRHQPSYIACGPIHATQTKAMPWQPQGDANLAYWSALLPRPVVAIGGMDPARAAAALRAGADGVAVLSGITTAADAEAAVARYQAAMAAARAQLRLQPPALPRPTLAGPAHHMPT